MQTYELNPSRQVAAGLNNMNSKRFAKRMKDSGVSPVIATILMVAITVVLAAVLYVMVSGFTHSPGTANSAGLNEAQATGTSWTVTVSSVSASNIGLSNLKIVISGGNATTDGTFTMGTLSSTGASMTFSVASSLTGSFTILSGNSGTYLSAGDYFTISSPATWASGSLQGLTVTLYSGNSNLGSTTL